MPQASCLESLRPVVETGRPLTMPDWTVQFAVHHGLVHWPFSCSTQGYGVRYFNVRYLAHLQYVSTNRIVRASWGPSDRTTHVLLLLLAAALQN